MMLAGIVVVAGGCSGPPVAPEPPLVLKSFTQDIPAAATGIEMIAVPGSADGAIKPFWISKTEVPWEIFDVYTYRLDDPSPDAPAPGKTGPDGITRPTKPYIAPDGGFGHDGYAAVGMSHHNATEFCRWLSKATGRVYRLPTEQEWSYACRAGASGDYAFAGDAAHLGDYAWFAGNSENAGHPVGQKKPNAWGLYDMLGNAKEWVNGADGQAVAMGGSWKDAAADVKVTSRSARTPAWNESDPQIPKSKWWMVNAPFVGIRLVCEPTSEARGAKGEKPAAATTPAPSATPADGATSAEGKKP